MSNYKIIVNQNESLVSLADISTLDIVQIGTNSLHVIDNNQSMLVEILHIENNGKTQILRANGEKYTISISDPKDQLIQNLGLNKSKDHTANKIKAPMPGLVLDILVVVGQDVKKGDPLLVLEAMKMENLIKASSDGVIEQILISKGSAVNKGQLMLEIS